MRAEKIVEDSRKRLVAVAVSPIGTLVLAVYEDQWQLWDVSNTPPECTRTAKHSTLDGSIAAWSSTGNLFACVEEGHVITVWESQTGNRIAAFAGHSDKVSAMVFTADEHLLLSASWDGSIYRWNIHQTLQETFSEVLFQADGDDIDALAVSSDGRWMLSGSSRRDSPPDTSSASLLARPSRQPVKYYDWYSALRLHDATGHVIWFDNHPRLITSTAFAEDCSYALMGDNEGVVSLYGLTQIIPSDSDKSAPRSPRFLVVPEHQLSSGSSRPVWHVSFSSDGHAIVTERSYTPLPFGLQPLTRCIMSSSRPPVYFLDDDGWLWRANEKLNHRRIRWLPPTFRPGPRGIVRTWSSPHGHGIACRTSDDRVVILDMSGY
ncbi:hypothetical protein NUW54_g11384 [Trametes sanguinea]|uniref:Uncharacterized protein n=1 Tax=Trametes sanguinea TaxID=158606 RepID=A0ACC1NFQ2_9APHY|nr:hypothetical protein NUW54_g11384 [Trametes sanguinea]